MGLADDLGDLGKIAAPVWGVGETHRFAAACGRPEVMADEIISRRRRSSREGRT